jgi:hypothetical protein
MVLIVAFRQQRSLRILTPASPKAKLFSAVSGRREGTISGAGIKRKGFPDEFFLSVCARSRK